MTIVMGIVMMHVVIMIVSRYVAQGKCCGGGDGLKLSDVDISFVNVGGLIGDVFVGGKVVASPGSGIVKVTASLQPLETTAI